MASIGQADHLPTPCHLNGISRLNCSPPTGALNSAPVSSYSNILAPNDYRDKYMMEMQTGYGRFHRNGSSGYSPSEMPKVWLLSGPTTADMPLLPQENTIRAAPIGMVGNDRASSEQISRGSPGGLLPSSSSELYGNTVVSGGDWEQFVDSNVRYAPLLSSSSSSSTLPHNIPHSGSRGANEGAMIRELMGHLGGNNSNGVPSLGGSPLVSSPQCSGTGGIDKSLVKLGNGWTSGDASTTTTNNNNMGLTVDPSKGGLALQGVGLATSHCLAHFASDPGFAERAARFSSFSNGNYTQPFHSSDSAAVLAAGKTRSRQGSAQASDNSSSCRQLQKTSSSCPSISENASPGAKSPKEDPASSGNHHNNNTCNDEVAAGTRGGVDVEQDARDAGEVEVKAAAGEKKLYRTSTNLSSAIDDDDHDIMQAGPSPLDEAAHEADAEANPAQETSSVGDAPGETCPSGVTNVTTIAKESLVKKRKGTLDDKSSKDTTSATVSSPGTRENKTSDSEDVKAKRFKRGDVGKDKEDVKPKAERSSIETLGETSPSVSAKEQSKPQEPPKPDYIHVRARRGQATDSHSLAERVRREKISERMKFLQDLVPGCSKVTGKAVMLDEIINYVQSLQRQVEFLSMKLAAVNPRLDFNIDSLLAKEVSRSQGMIMGPETSYPQLHPQHQPQLQQHGGVPCGLEYPVQTLGNHSHVALRRSVSAPITAAVPRDDGFADGAPPGVWDDGELQSIVQMGFGHLKSLSSLALLHGQLPPGHMKVEL